MKKLFFMTLAGAVMFACQNPGGDPTPNNGDTNTVSITIKKSATTRATLGDDVHTGAFTELTAGTLYFYEGNNIVLTYQIPEADIDSPAATFIVKGVPSNATTVTMIANPATDIDLSPAPTTFAEFLNVQFGIALQADMAGGAGDNGNGEPLAVQGIALLDMLDEGAANELVPYEGDAQDIDKEVVINLIPAMLRIEIGSLEAEAIVVKGPEVTRAGTEESATKLVSFDLDGIYINNYATSFTLGQEQGSPLFGADIQPWTGTGDWSARYVELSDAEYGEHPTFEGLYDEVDMAVTRSLPGVGKFAYHIFPGYTGGKTPHIIIKVSNLEYEDGRNVEGTKYWLIDKYWEDAAKTTPVRWEPGFVYKIARIDVGDSYPTDDPYLEPQSVEVTVEVQPWTVKPIYVTPN